MPFGNRRAKQQQHHAWRVYMYVYTDHRTSVRYFSDTGIPLSYGQCTELGTVITTWQTQTVSGYGQDTTATVNSVACRVRPERSLLSSRATARRILRLTYELTVFQERGTGDGASVVCRRHVCWLIRATGLNTQRHHWERIHLVLPFPLISANTLIRYSDSISSLFVKVERRRAAY